MHKLSIFNSIRKKVKLPKSKKSYFSTEEIKVIASSINPNANLDGVRLNDMLPSIIHNWKKQKTVSSHPNSENLYAIFKSLSTNSNKKSLVYIIKNMPESVLEDAKSISFINGELTIKFLNH
ncbi:hypothetical protein N9W84_01535 [bacterium]|nr:hypothetical protein [bacterium]